MVTTLTFPTLQKAWEGINKYLATTPPEELEKGGGGGGYGTEYIAYSTLVVINSAWVDPEFDFAKVLGYTAKKWTTLVKNYVDFDYLDLVKSDITTRRKKGAKSYNIAYHFANKYGGGKDCLLSLVFSKRLNEEFPTVFFNVRVSEVTSRLIFDFLLVQRIIEYVYGEGHPAEVHFYAPSMFITAERFSMFAHWEGWEKVEKKLGNTLFQNRIRQVYQMMKTKPANTITYKSHARCAEVIQKYGHKVKGTLKAKELQLHSLVPDLDESVKTLTAMKKLKKKLRDETSK